MNKESIYYQEYLFSHLKCGLYFWGGYVVLLLVTVVKTMQRWDKCIRVLWDYVQK